MAQIVEVPGEGNVEFPDGMSDQDISRVIRLHIPEPETKGSQEWVSWRNQRLHDLNDHALNSPEPEDPGFLNTLRTGLVNAFKSTVGATNPDTGRWGGPMQGLENLLVGAGTGAKAEAASATNSAKKGDYLEAAGHGLAAAVPVFGPAAAEAGTDIGEGRTKQGLTKAAMLLVPFAAGPALGAAGDAVDRVAPGLRPAAADALRENAETQYARVLNPTTKANKLRTAEVVPQLIDRGVKAGTLKGLQAQAAEQVSRVGQAIGDEWQNLPAGTSAPLQPIIDRLQHEVDDVHSVDGGTKQVTATPPASGVLGPNGQPIQPGPVTTTQRVGLIPKGPVAKQAIDNISALQKTLEGVAEKDPQTGAMVIPVEKLRDLRQYFDEVQKAAGAFDGTNLKQQSIAAAHQVAADAIRRELGNQFPDIDALNKEYSFWKDVHQITSDTLTRRQGQAVPISAKIAQAGGLVKGGVLGAEAMKSLTTALRSPAWGTVSAVLKDRLADSLAKGNALQSNSVIQQIRRAIAAQSIIAPQRQTAEPAAIPGR